MAAQVDLVDIKVGIAVARAVLAVATVVGKALAAHKFLVKRKVVVVHKTNVGKFLVEFAEFQVCTNKFQREQLPQMRDLNQAASRGLPIE